MTQETPGRRVAGAVANFISAHDVRYADRPRALLKAFEDMVAEIDAALGENEFIVLLKRLRDRCEGEFYDPIFDEIDRVVAAAHGEPTLPKQEG